MYDYAVKRLPLRTIVISLSSLLFLTAFTLYDANNTALADSQVAYSLVIRNLTPTINPGNTLEIEVFFSGYGIPSKNKLYVSWSSAKVIDRDTPGTIEVAGLGPVGIDPNGNITVLPSDIFSISPIIKAPPDYGIPLIRSETSLSGKYPILLKLNTSKTAPSGNYDITFVFTYGDDQNMYQDYKTTQFHISNFWERKQLWFQITAVLIALASLLTGAIFSWLAYRKKPQKHWS
jgi:hypothetical protein